MVSSEHSFFFLLRQCVKISNLQITLEARKMSIEYGNNLKKNSHFNSSIVKCVNFLKEMNKLKHVKK